MFLYWIGIYKMHTYIHIALIKTHHQDVKVNIEKIIQKGRINQTKKHVLPLEIFNKRMSRFANRTKWRFKREMWNIKLYDEVPGIYETHLEFAKKTLQNKQLSVRILWYLHCLYPPVAWMGDYVKSIFTWIVKSSKCTVKVQNYPGMIHRITHEYKYYHGDRLKLVLSVWWYSVRVKVI